MEDERKALLRADGDAYNDELQRRIDTYPQLPGESANETVSRIGRALRKEIGWESGDTRRQEG